MIIKKLPLGPIEANTYIIFDEKSKEAVVIEASGNAQKIKEELSTLNAKLKYILLTHGHFDHVFALNELKELYPDAKAFLNKNDKPLITDCLKSLRKTGRRKRRNCLCINNKTGKSGATTPFLVEPGAGKNDAIKPDKMLSRKQKCPTKKAEAKNGFS